VTERPLDYDSLKRLAEELRRPVMTLIAQPSISDPFYADLPLRREQAEWFRSIWDKFEIQPGIHLRFIHYRLVTTGAVPLPRVITWKDKETRQQKQTEVYINNGPCSHFLGTAARDARYLGLISIDSVIDQRNEETEINYAPDETSAHLLVSSPPVQSSMDLSLDVTLPDFPHLPGLYVVPPSVPQPYCVEVWCEKSTMDGILVPLCQRHHANYTPGTGQISLTRCNDLINRAREHGKPVRVLSHFADGRIGEVFLSNHKSNSSADVNARDAAIVFSIAVQHGADPEVIRKALCRNAIGQASGPLAAALDAITKEGAP
jgi:hypothetical protein